MVSVTNYGRRTRIFRDAKGRVVVLKYGQTKEAELNETQLQLYNEQIGTHDPQTGEFRPFIKVGDPGPIAESGESRPRRRR